MLGDNQAVRHLEGPTTRALCGGALLPLRRDEVELGEVREALAEGRTLAELEVGFGVRPGTLATWLAEDSTDPMKQQQIDLAAVEADLAAGASVRETARKYSISESTLRGKLRIARANRSPNKPDKGPRRRPGANGHPVPSELSELADLMDARWNAMSPVEKLWRLLAEPPETAGMPKISGRRSEREN